jgi:hypothetical protein
MKSYLSIKGCHLAQVDVQSFSILVLTKSITVSVGIVPAPF